jgi:predicted NBD/HSP70 family sugar kinase
MRFYTQQHPFYCGIDLHARTMYLCILNRDGEILVHRNMKTKSAHTTLAHWQHTYTSNSRRSRTSSVRISCGVI